MCLKSLKIQFIYMTIGEALEAQLHTSLSSITFRPGDPSMLQVDQREAVKETIAAELMLVGKFLYG